MIHAGKKMTEIMPCTMYNPVILREQHWCRFGNSYVPATLFLQTTAVYTICTKITLVNVLRSWVKSSANQCQLPLLAILFR